MTEVHPPAPTIHTIFSVALGYHRFWLSFATFIAGLHAGISVTFCLFVIENPTESNKFNVPSIAEHYSLFSMVFSYCSLLCLVLVLDRFDLNHLDTDHILDILVTQLSYLVVPIYFTSLIAHCVGVYVDEKLIAAGYTRKYYIVTNDELNVMSKIWLVKSFMALIGWWFVALHRNRDLLEIHLKNLEKYEEDEEVSIEF